ncbi:MAG: hypothetical protein ACM31K_04845 [Solirubrobacterales bacterium]
MPEGVVAAPRRAEVADLPALARMPARVFVEDPVAVRATRPDESIDRRMRTWIPAPATARAQCV